MTSKPNELLMWYSTPNVQYNFQLASSQTNPDMKAERRGAISVQRGFNSPRGGREGNEKKSKLRNRKFDHCQNIIFWVAAAVLVLLFTLQVRALTVLGWKVRPRMMLTNPTRSRLVPQELCYPKIYFSDVLTFPR